LPASSGSRPQARSTQLLLGHTKIESTARYLETELNAALKISEKVEL